MDYRITNDSVFTGKIYKVEVYNQTVFIGIANYTEGCDIYFPQAGTEYTLIMLNNSIYRFLSSEFTNPCSISYIAEKLNCDKDLAEFVYSFVQDILMSDAAYKLLHNQQYDMKNPFLV